MILDTVRIIAVFFLLLSPYAVKGNASCLKLIDKVFKQNNPTSSITSLDELLTAFTKGLEPDLEDRDQRTAFRIYRKMRFGNPNTSLSSGSSQKIAQTLKKYPQLKNRIRFRNYVLEKEHKSYPVTPELSRFLDPQFKSVGRVKANLFQVNANQGYWKKVLGYQAPEELRVKPRDKAERKLWQQKNREHLRAFLDERFLKELRDFLEDQNLPVKKRASRLYEYMLEQREKMLSRGEDVRALSQALVNLVHSIGFFDKGLQRELKSKDGKERLLAFRKILNERDSFAMELGFEGHFEEVLETFSVPFPTGLIEQTRLSQVLQSLEEGLEKSVRRETSSGSRQTIRHLSLIESPFRSCVGGSDCASRTYLTKALDPNYHYFTLTDEEGFSSGHITVVLGTVKNGDEKVKVAFVDKVQNVDNGDLPLMIEGVRRTVEEKGYTLALPENMGDHNGISNEQVTRNFIQNNIAMNPKKRLRSFSPHPHSYGFSSGYSRAEEKLPLRRVLPLEGEAPLQPGELLQPWKSADFSLNTLAKESVRLKKGSVEDRIRYIESMKLLNKVEGFQGDPHFEKTLTRWLEDPSTEGSLRKQVAIFYWREKKRPLFLLLKHFKKQERINMVQNLWDTPRYKKLIIKEDKLLALAFSIRGSQPGRALLQETLSLEEARVKIAFLVFDSEDIPHDGAIKILEKMGDLEFSFSHIEKMKDMANLVKGSDVADLFERGLRTQLAKNLDERRLFRYLEDPFVQKLFTEEKTPSPLVKTYRSFIHGEKNLEEWLESSEDLALKGEFLLSQVGIKSEFQRYFNLIPPSHHKEVWEAMDRETSLSVYLKFAQKRGMEQRLLTRSILKSFEFKKLTMPDGHRFEIQRTQETQLKWEVVVGKNSFFFKGDNRPVENVSWEDVQQYIKKLNESLGLKGCRGLPQDPKGCYRLPTEQEWEFAARGGTSSEYFFGNNSSRLNRYAWFDENAERKTHPVGLKGENPYGLYDVYGNVWEWMQDTYTSRLLGRNDLLQDRSPSYRVVRGGSWFNFARLVSSTDRNGVGPVSGNDYVGFRLVRTL